MADETFRFDDGASYELMMGRWSVLVGERSIDWIGVPNGARWLDIGCGNGAFRDMFGGGFPLADIGAEMLKLHQVQTCQITVQRRFDSFDDYWNSAAPSNTLRPMFEVLQADRRELLKAKVRR